MAHLIDAKTGKRFWLIGRQGELLRSDFDPMVDNRLIGWLVAWALLGAFVLALSLTVVRTENPEGRQLQIYGFIVSSVLLLVTACIAVHLIERRAHRRQLRDSTLKCNSSVIREDAWSYQLVEDFAPLYQAMLKAAYVYHPGEPDIRHPQYENIVLARVLDAYFTDTRYFNRVLRDGTWAGGTLDQVERQRSARSSCILLLEQLMLNTIDESKIRGITTSAAKEYLASLRKQSHQKMLQDLAHVEASVETDLEALRAYREERIVETSAPAG